MSSGTASRRGDTQDDICGGVRIVKPDGISSMKRYRLLGADGEVYESVEPGTLRGVSRLEALPGRP